MRVALLLFASLLAWRAPVGNASFPHAIRCRRKTLPSKPSSSPLKVNIFQRVKRRLLTRRAFLMALYWVSSVEAAHAVAKNDYSGMLVVRREKDARLAGRVYSTLFFFARLRPRLLFSVGSLMRALQLCTPLQRVINPGVGPCQQETSRKIDSWLLDYYQYLTSVFVSSTGRGWVWNQLLCFRRRVKMGISSSAWVCIH